MKTSSKFIVVLILSVFITLGSASADASKQTVPPPVNTGCTIKIGGVVCTEHPLEPSVAAENAATAYQMYGFNADVVHQSYTESFLQSHMCAGIVRAGHVIKELGRGKIATPNGWVEVTRADIDDKLVIYTATNYLEGTCKK